MPAKGKDVPYSWPNLVVFCRRWQGGTARPAFVLNSEDGTVTGWLGPWVLSRGVLYPRICFTGPTIWKLEEKTGFKG